MNALMVNSIIDGFNEYFDMVPALSEELKREAYKLRYQVYCLETGFEDSNEYPEGLEFDEFDKRSLHYLIYHRKQKIYMATVRLILPDMDNHDQLFPIEIHSQIDNVDALKHISRNHLAEASRFCVSRAFRRRKNEMNSITGAAIDMEDVFTQEERRVIPNITLALVACVIKMSHENNIHDWYAVMEPALIRVFSALGINFITLGPLTNYHGKRQPCTINVNDLLDGVAHKNLSHWNMLTNKGRFWKPETH
jgi:N-acyl amino acid synthase of PEP-CTERM/exosortase system